jgi:hypothetical protein
MSNFPSLTKTPSLQRADCISHSSPPYELQEEVFKYVSFDSQIVIARDDFESWLKRHKTASLAHVNARLVLLPPLLHRLAKQGQSSESISGPSIDVFFLRQLYDAGS